MGRELADTVVELPGVLVVFGTYAAILHASIVPNICS
jgi:hypothetical protein